jgi:hypothetical protein
VAFFASSSSQSWHKKQDLEITTLKTLSEISLLHFVTSNASLKWKNLQVLCVRRTCKSKLFTGKVPIVLRARKVRVAHFNIIYPWVNFDG